MSKFGELIDLKIPVLLNFHSEGNEKSKVMDPVLRDVVTKLGSKVKVIKIDIDKNSQLAEALHVKTVPTLIIYKAGEMKWRQSGEQVSATLVGILKEYL
ncbi:thioredoxin 1 [Salegentibacter echinorum]|uniref:Thioredoxin 1 n=1 Tax=Salegentibacter echinorum TaxID=1073325 RepID=A0A1M5E7A3_SALEC|nr:thioredoxin family protein [Salegentibacter echinorum]SHF75014.1 thioredoxin 1 [Salegentibacter echinorum]